MSFDAKVRGLLASGCSKLQRGFLWKEGLIDTIDIKNPAGPKTPKYYNPCSRDPPRRHPPEFWETFILVSTEGPRV